MGLFAGHQVRGVRLKFEAPPLEARRGLCKPCKGLAVARGRPGKFIDHSIHRCQRWAQYELSRMILTALISFLPALLAASEAPAAPGVRIMRVEEQIILRVPVQPRPRLRVRWEEEDGPKCLPVRALAGAMLSGEHSIDFLLRNRTRMRAKLDDNCRGLDFYDGFYLLPEEDRRICAGRDVIRSRMGGTCGIDKFRTLVPRTER